MRGRRSHARRLPRASLATTQRLPRLRVQCGRTTSGTTSSFHPPISWQLQKGSPRGAFCVSTISGLEEADGRCHSWRHRPFPSRLRRRATSCAAHVHAKNRTRRTAPRRGRSRLRGGDRFGIGRWRPQSAITVVGVACDCQAAGRLRSRRASDMRERRGCDPAVWGSALDKPESRAWNAGNAESQCPPPLDKGLGSGESGFACTRNSLMTRAGSAQGMRWIWC